MIGGLTYRQPTEADHAVLIDRVDDWWDRRTQSHLPRLWFRHFAVTSLIAESPNGALEGFLVGFMSQDRPDEAYLHLVGVAPGRRRAGTGRGLVERFVAEVARRGATRVTTIAWPGDPAALAFLRAVGFEVEAGPGTQRLYGTPAHVDWNRPGDDQALLTRRI